MGDIAAQPVSFFLRYVRSCGPLGLEKITKPLFGKSGLRQSNYMARKKAIQKPDGSRKATYKINFSTGQEASEIFSG